MPRSTRTKKPQPAPSQKKRGARRVSGGFFSLFRVPQIDFSLLAGRAGMGLTLLAFVVLMLAVYLAASIFTGWTGSLGAAARSALLDSLGGAVLVPIACIAYLCVSIITRRKIPSPISHGVGVITLFFCASLMLGLLDLAFIDRPRYAVLEPGRLGRYLAFWMYDRTGPLGTTLGGVAAACFALICFGCTRPFMMIANGAWSIYEAVYKVFVRPRGKHDRPQPEPAAVQEPEAESTATAEAILGDDAEADNSPDAPEAPQEDPQTVQKSIYTSNDMYQYEDLPDEVYRERSRALLERARALTAAQRARDEEAAREAALNAEAMKEAIEERSRRPLVDEYAPPVSALQEVPCAVEPEPEQEAEQEPDDLPAEDERVSEPEAVEEDSPVEAACAPEPEQAPAFRIMPPSEPGPEAPEEEPQMELPSPVEVTTVDEMEYDESVRVKRGVFPPPFELYGEETDFDGGITQEMARPWGEQIIASLSQFKIEAELAGILIGPTVIQFRIQPQPGVNVNKIVSLANNLALDLAVASLSVEAPIPSMPYVGIEIPNPKRRGITLRSVIESDAFQESEAALPLPMGVTISGDPLAVGLESMPHMLVAGTTGSGKSVFVNSCIVGLCSMRTPDELKMILVDPKWVEMVIYEKLPHLLTPPINDPKKAVHVLAWAVREMERRYSLLAAIKVRSLSAYNDAVIPKDRLPYIVIVIDELADLMMTASKEVEEYICRIAQKARAIGIHLILATQRPSVDVVTGLIKANVPARVSFTLASVTDSRTILDTGGAEKLLGRGDMLFVSSTTGSSKPLRVQAPWIDEKAIMKWLDHLEKTFGAPEFIEIEDQGGGPSGSDESYDDALLGDAVRLVLKTGMPSASGLQRRLSVGYARAARLIDMMESAGIVGPSNGAKPRDILVDEEEAEEILERLGL